MAGILKALYELGKETNCVIRLDFYRVYDPRRNVQIDDHETHEGKTCEVDWSWSEDKILKTIAESIEEMKARPKCFNCKHYNPDPGFFEICGCDCNNFNKYEDKNEMVTFNEF